MNLDEKIIIKKQEALSNRTLDIDWFNIDVNMENIYALIVQEAAELSVEGMADRVKNIEKDELFEIEREDNVNSQSFSMFVKVKNLLKYDGSEFVSVCYRNILLREVDSIGLRDSLQKLWIQDISKLDFIFMLANSVEGRTKGVKLVGCHWSYKVIKLFKKSFRIPIIGKIIHYISKLFRVNKTLYQMMIWNTELQSRINTLEEERLKTLEDNVRNNNVLLQKCINTNITKRMNIFEKNIQERIKNLDKVIKESVKNLDKDIKESVKNLDKDISENSILFQKRIDELERKKEWDRLNILEENIRNNNILLDNHGKTLDYYDDFVNKNSKILQNLVVDVCNMKADIQSIQNIEKSSLDAKNLEKQSMEVSADAYFAIDYFDFENKFRGSREHVKKVQNIYLPYFENKSKVVDLGCGRGEFVELLMENHIGVQGVDQYVPYVEFCKMKNLPVKHDDAIAFLNKQNTVDGIFLGQVVEHLQLEQIIGLCRIAYEKLESDCYLIIETPNPTSLAIYTEAFYIDPSHNKPIHPKTLQYIVEKEGFSCVEILYTDSSRLPYNIPEISKEEDESIQEFNDAMKRVSNLLYGSQDYAIIARK